jgi:hypothetical protein
MGLHGLIFFSRCSSVQKSFSDCLGDAWPKWLKECIVFAADTQFPTS